MNKLALAAVATAALGAAATSPAYAGIALNGPQLTGIALPSVASSQPVVTAVTLPTEGDIDLRGFFGLDPAVASGYQELRSRVVIKGDGTEEQFRKIHELVLTTSPNFYNVTRAVPVTAALMIE
jgi:hypothetical protein